MLPGRLVWPLPALLAWTLAWAFFIALRLTDVAALPGAVLPIALGCALAMFGATRWRRVFIAAGFPLSLLASGAAADLPAWAWLLPLGALALLYPARTWRDAPLFPTPHGALDGLADQIVLPPSPLILDAGCGLGAALRALRRAWPQARLHGIEWSWPLQRACTLRCRFATVRQGDIWRADWSAFDLVYLFQRPESLPRAIEKARRELRPGAWLASLEFQAAGVAPSAIFTCPDGRPLWLYRMPRVG
ncbi:MAG: class I SAM-dependent methyltransferase [Burkholderiaceae bacterium]